jgi:hypothetical protein
MIFWKTPRLRCHGWSWAHSLFCIKIWTLDFPGRTHMRNSSRRTYGGKSSDPPYCRLCRSIVNF